MAKLSDRGVTYEDLAQIPDHLVGEIVEGELFASPRPASPHARASTVLSGYLVARFDEGHEGPGGWWILFEPELHLGHDVLVPDIAGWRRERMLLLPNTPAFTLSPDWVCEVVSPTTSRLDRVKKLPAYARYGVTHAWLVDPEQQTLEVYRLLGGQWVLIATHEGEDIVHAEPFEAAGLFLSALWLPKAPPA